MVSYGVNLLENEAIIEKADQKKGWRENGREGSVRLRGGTCREINDDII